MSESKIETAQFLSEQFNKLSFVPTDKEMDYATMLKIYFYWNEDVLISVSVDKNGVFFLNGTTESYEISSGSFDYDLIKEIYDKSRER